MQEEAEDEDEDREPISVWGIRYQKPLHEANVLLLDCWL